MSEEIRGDEFKKMAVAYAAWVAEDPDARKGQKPDVAVLLNWLMDKTKALTFRELAEVNAGRANRWHRGFPNNTDGWNGADWSNAMQGEGGEAGNVVKKLRRLETSVRQAEQAHLTDDEMRDKLLQKLEKEIGDTLIYADLLAQYYGLALEECVITAFNQVSEREGFPERL